LRTRLFKIGARVRQTARCVRIHLASGWPFPSLFQTVARLGEHSSPAALVWNFLALGSCGRSLSQNYLSGRLLHSLGLAPSQYASTPALTLASNDCPTHVPARMNNAG